MEKHWEQRGIKRCKGTGSQTLHLAAMMNTWNSLPHGTVTASSLKKTASMDSSEAPSSTTTSASMLARRSELKTSRSSTGLGFSPMDILVLLIPLLVPRMNSKSRFRSVMGMPITRGRRLYCSLSVTPGGGCYVTTSKRSIAASHVKVVLVRWNEPYQKLATCDSLGVIFVWIKHEGRWSIELINDRNSQVRPYGSHLHQV
ncbi:tubby-related protein 4 [Elysia marginata]|uniref:Tubby-related protein 4 n=1 Tax=Elysia marginata TaxID=1093978 RepID=A0AAV4HCW4_9GAST|nr:tubby-related protein 4 [Elysia marginata]